ncbi:hypothetical protein [Pseudomonas sp.]|uniref:hypothetical protein n=1 Tax=Pseudomonas sp. TaxID=306 RepID=UPI003F2EA0E6
MNPEKQENLQQVGEFVVNIQGNPTSVTFTDVQRHPFPEDNGGYLRGIRGNEAGIWIGYAKEAQPQTTETYHYPADFQNKPYVTWVFDNAGERHYVETGKVTVSFSRNLEATGSFELIDKNGKNYTGTFAIRWQK